MNNFDQLTEKAKSDENVLGLILLGSRGKGFNNEHSDYDASLILKDSLTEESLKKYKETKFEDTDVSVKTFSEFKNYAVWESAEVWDRYDYAHAKILVDKTGELPQIIQGKGYIPQENLKKFIERSIDGYVNGVFRSVKCIRNKNKFGAHIEASNSMLDLLTLVFGMNGRHRPFLGYVEKELKLYPLKNLPWSPEDFVEKIETVLSGADLATQQELLVGIEKVGREMGYGHMFDGWEGKDKWAMTFK